MLTFLCFVVLLIFAVSRARRRPQPLSGIAPVSCWDSCRFVLEDLLPRGRGQAPFLRRLHEQYGAVLQIGSFFSFAPTGDAASDDVFRAIARLPKSSRVYSIMDPPVPTIDPPHHVVSHQTIFTQRDQHQWRSDHKKAAPMFRVQSVKERQSIIWPALDTLHSKISKLCSRGEAIDLTPPLRAFAADLTCLWLVSQPYGALKSLEDGQTFADAERDLGPILTSLNRNFGWAYYSPRLVAKWQAIRPSICHWLDRSGLCRSLASRWSREDASLTGWTSFVDQAVQSGFDPPGSFSDHFASLLLDGASSNRIRESVSAQMLDAIFAGTDTLTAVLSLSLYVLGSDEPAVREAIQNVRKELPDAPWHSQDLESLPWLSATVRELLRLADANPHPLERIMPPSLTDIHPALAAVPPGARVGVAGYVVHRSRVAYGDNPDAFFARRWLPPDHADHALPPGTGIRADELKTYWMAFGRTPRACIAQPFANAVVTCTLASWIATYDVQQKGRPDLVESGWRDCFNSTRCLPSFTFESLNVLQRCCSVIA